LSEGKKFNSSRPRVHTDEDVSIAISIGFAERDHIESVRGERSAADGADAGENFLTSGLDFLTDQACGAMTLDFLFDPSGGFTGSRSHGFYDTSVCA
jgi:hypothetical protein